MKGPHVLCIVIEARAVHRVNPDGSRVREELPSPSITKVTTPVHITDVHNCVLQSGAAIYTGKLQYNTHSRHTTLIY